MILILKHGLDVSPHQRQEERDPCESMVVSNAGKRKSTKAGRYKVEQCRLGVLVDVHHKDCQEEAGQVSWTVIGLLRAPAECRHAMTCLMPRFIKHPV